MRYRDKKYFKIFDVVICLLFLSALFWNGFVNQKIVVAVLDTGYTGESERVMAGWNYIDNSGNVEDKNGHGTKITELILERTTGQVVIVPVKIADNAGNASEQAVCQGIRYAMENGVDIIHMSLNMNRQQADRRMAEAVRSACEAGIVVVVSAGNNAKDVKDVFPANLEETIVVSAVDSENVFCEFSNYGETIDFAAYGQYLGEQGTSYAAARATAVIASEYADGGNLQTVRNRAIDAGIEGKDSYYGEGILLTEEVEAEDIAEKTYIGKTENDIGYQLLDIDWKGLDAETLDQYFVETHKAYVGMFLSRLREDELEELKQKSKVLNTSVFVQNFIRSESGMEYRQVMAYEEDFITNAIKKYQEYEKELTLSADWLMIRDNGYFAVSSNNREDIYYFTISGFSYTVDHGDSPWFAMFHPDALTVTRTTVKKSTDFGALYVEGLTTYLSSVNAFAISYIHPETGQTISEDNLYAIDSEADEGSLCYGLSIKLAGYRNEKEGYHTEEKDIVQIPYNYQHAYEQYSYADYKEPLTYFFSYYDSETNDVLYADSPQRVQVQEKNFKKIILTNYNMWYNGKYKVGYDYRNVDESLSLSEKLSTYLKSWDTKMVPNVNVYSQETSLTDTGFYINADLQHSLGIQWNNGESATVALQNDVPEYNFPLKVNTYTVKYHGNGAVNGAMSDTTMTYNVPQNLAVNDYSREGYLFRGWSTKPDGKVEYSNGQLVCNLTLSHNVTVDLYAVWEPMTYTIIFHGNGATGGTMQDIEAQCNKPIQLPSNSYIRSNEYGPSVFRGWSLQTDAVSPTYLDGEVITNMNAVPDSVINLYAVWDDCPWIVAEDLYFTLKEAQEGFITYEKLMSHGYAEDREAGGTVLPGIDEEQGTKFVILDYKEEDYTQLWQDGSVMETYQVTDRIGNVYEKTITVYIVDTTACYEIPDGTIRFINENYYEKPYERGGLEETSIWKSNPEYRKTLEETFKNSREDTPLASFYYTYEEIQEMK